MRKNSAVHFEQSDAGDVLVDDNGNPLRLAGLGGGGDGENRTPMVFEGDYLASKGYEVGSVVRHNGSSWVAVDGPIPIGKEPGVASQLALVWDSVTYEPDEIIDASEPHYFEITDATRQFPSLPGAGYAGQNAHILPFHIAQPGRLRIRMTPDTADQDMAMSVLRAYEEGAGHGSVGSDDDGGEGNLPQGEWTFSTVGWYLLIMSDRNSPARGVGVIWPYGVILEPTTYGSVNPAVVSPKPASTDGEWVAL